MPKVRQERTGWRDNGLSQRHRLWGFDCPAVDIDFLLIEYSRCQPKALIEYKNEHSPKNMNLNGASFQALINLGNMSKLPVFLCRYRDSYKEFFIKPLNKYAINKLPKGQLMTEQEYVEFLYKLRGDKCPDWILDNLEIS